MYSNIIFILLMWCKAAVYLHYDILICSKLTDFYINIPDNIIQWWRRGVDDGGGSGSGNHGTINNVKNHHRNFIVWVIITSEVAFKSLARGWSPPSYIYTNNYTTHKKHHADGHFKLFSVNDFHNSSSRGLITGVHRGRQNRVCPFVIVIVTCSSSPNVYHPASVYISGVLDYLFIIITIWLFAYECKNTNLKVR